MLATCELTPRWPSRYVVSWRGAAAALPPWICHRETRRCRAGGGPRAAAALRSAAGLPPRTRGSAVSAEDAAEAVCTERGMPRFRRHPARVVRPAATASAYWLKSADRRKRAGRDDVDRSDVARLGQD